jgi:chorismate mutase/prephenate dehydratase
MSITPEDALRDLRDQIDAVDQQILDCLSRRARLAQSVAQIKEAHEGADAVFYRPEREAQVLDRLVGLNQGPLPDADVELLFREIMSSCRALERRLRVAYLGPEGTYTQEAVIRQFGHAVHTVPLNSIDEVFRDVAAGSCEYGVVPVENSTEGVVSHTLDTLKNAALKICGEVELSIHHHLLVGARTQADQITRIYAHAQTLGQCRQWLDAHYPGVERVAVSSNARAARMVQIEWNSAAIAGGTAAEIYGLTKISECIEDSPDNTTRFLVLSARAAEPSGHDKTSIVVSMHNKPGALHSLLGVFNEAGIDLTKIETRPSRSQKWNYLFFIDFVGHFQDTSVQQVLQKIEEQSQSLRYLGSYPMARSAEVSA